ncbi:hypothetical protein A3I56_00335 [Candidatus Roizmanbacteria bacterium RIFCSPLOWO2_02_FULL_43_10]|uniref:Uncharacterized protein n=2 Tax=Candidatus Roizmaniibacteriota TaxID=1752723 RepID=A0A1F7JU99_9BACT|nr:MAG: hypothetical protein A3F32_02505 [Candidatus Roizmanbacteria bacterium RIFCSPHIGHO2_12_FULL_42_10]OGK59170.1 MAG: hypothetical protein A3I56_00335 [Candidatus Roizmanbacteria bacterium RIFCSPLOWO2_02_FULL_43_10]
MIPERIFETASKPPEYTYFAGFLPDELRGINGLVDLFDRVVFACGAHPLDLVIIMALHSGRGSIAELYQTIQSYQIPGLGSGQERIIERLYTRLIPSGILRYEDSDKSYTINEADLKLVRNLCSSLIAYCLEFGPIAEPLLHKRGNFGQDGRNYLVRLAMILQLYTCQTYDGPSKPYNVSNSKRLNNLIADGFVLKHEKRPNPFKLYGSESARYKRIPVDGVLRLPVADHIGYFQKYNHVTIGMVAAALGVERDLSSGIMGELRQNRVLESEDPKKEQLEPVSLSRQGTVFASRVILPLLEACTVACTGSGHIDMPSITLQELRTAHQAHAASRKKSERRPFATQATGVSVYLSEHGPISQKGLIEVFGGRIVNVLPGMLVSGGLVKVKSGNTVFYMLPGQSRASSSGSEELSTEPQIDKVEHVRRLSYRSTVELLPLFENPYFWRNLEVDMLTYHPSAVPTMEGFLMFFSDRNRSALPRDEDGRLHKGKYFKVWTCLAKDMKPLWEYMLLYQDLDIGFDPMALVKTYLHMRAPAHIKRLLEKTFPNDWKQESCDVIGVSFSPLQHVQYRFDTELFQDMERGRAAQAKLEACGEDVYAGEDICRVIRKGERAQELLASEHIRLVFYFIRHCTRIPITADSISAGLEGLLKALHNFEWRTGWSFGSFAKGYIKGYVVMTDDYRDPVSLDGGAVSLDCPLRMDTETTRHATIGDPVAEGDIDRALERVGLEKFLADLYEKGIVTDLQYTILDLWLDGAHGDSVYIAKHLNVAPEDIEKELEAAFSAIREVVSCGNTGFL